jgi:hypothetical protein
VTTAPEELIVTDYGPGGHRYNDDLLLAKEARERAQREHEVVFHVLDHEALRASFSRENDDANRAKRQSHVAGYWAVAAALLALAGAASEPLWGHLAAPWPRVIASASATLGLLSFFVSAGWLIYGKRKASWLYARLYTERLRQFHFQSFVWRLPEIIASLQGREDSRALYRAERDQCFKIFEDEFKGKGDTQMSAILNPAGVPSIWLHPVASIIEEPVVPDTAGGYLKDVFRAYEVFRFDEQWGYAEFMLRQHNRPEPAKNSSSRRRRTIWSWYPGINQPLRVKRKVLSFLWIVALIILVGTHGVVLVSHIAGWHLVEGPWAHVAIVWAALLAVAVKTLSEGFALTHEIERYEEYHAVVSGLRQAFRAAESPRKKVHIMAEMEKAAFEEMRVFLRSHHEATFIM